MSDEEVKVVERARDRIRDLLFDHTLDLEAQLRRIRSWEDPLGIAPRLEKDIAEINATLDASGLGIFEQLEVWMDLIEAKGI